MSACFSPFLVNKENNVYNIIMNKKEFIERYGEEAYKRKLENDKASREANKEVRKEKARAYYLKNRDRLLEKSKDSYEKDKDAHLARQKKYYEANKDAIREYKQEYYKANTKSIKEKSLEYYSDKKNTRELRAVHLIASYRLSERRHNRGECTITKQWILENIFNSKCIYCGESDWQKLGCDRKDNNLPHTPENCICACKICNIERHYKHLSVEDFKKEKMSAKNNPFLKKD